MSINRLIYISLIILTCSCASQKKENQHSEDYQVLNAYLEQNKDSIIFNTNTLSLDYRNPESFFQSYLYFSKRFKRFRTKKELFNEKEIEELKIKYSDWDIGIWDTKLITQKKITFTDSIKKIYFKHINDSIYETVYIHKYNVYTVSKPFYCKKNKKAFLIINIYTKKEGYHGGGLSLALMKKIKDKWVFYGGAPIY